MIMAWQGKNIPQSYSSIALFQTPGYIGVAFLLYVTTLSSGAQAGEYFNPHLLEVTESSATAVDLSWLSQDTIPPGSYNLDIYINDKYISSEVVEFKKNTDNQQIKVQPCIGVELLRSWSINTERYPQLADMATHCARLSVIPGLEYSVSLSQQRLALSVPQAALLNRPGDYVPEEQWQQGINAGLLNYSLSGQWNTPRHGGSATESQFASLQPGINLGPWRLRNYSTFDHGDGGSHWQSVYSYLARDIHTLRSQFVLGNTYTSSGIYDSEFYWSATKL